MREATCTGYTGHAGGLRYGSRGVYADGGVKICDGATTLANSETSRSHQHVAATLPIGEQQNLLLTDHDPTDLQADRTATIWSTLGGCTQG